MFLWDLAAVLYDINKKLQFFEVFERLRALSGLCNSMPLALMMSVEGSLALTDHDFSNSPTSPPLSFRFL